MKKQLWLAIAGLAGLAAIVIWTSISTRELTATHEFPSVSKSKPTVDNSAAQQPMPEVSRLRAAASIVPAAPRRHPAPSRFQPVTSMPTPEFIVAPIVPDAVDTLPDLLPGSDGVGFDLPLPSGGSLWSSLVHVESARANYGWEKFDLLSEKAAAEPVQTLDVSRMSNIGAAYRLLKSDDTMFRGRLAGGISRDYAGLLDRQQIPEVLLGLQWEHHISGGSKLLGLVEFARDVTDFSRYRVRTQAAWEVLLAADKNVSLRTAIMESSNKAPSGEQAKTLDCNLDVIWKF